VRVTHSQKLREWLWPALLCCAGTAVRIARGICAPMYEPPLFVWSRDGFLASVFIWLSSNTNLVPLCYALPTHYTPRHITTVIIVIHVLYVPLQLKSHFLSLVQLFYRMLRLCLEILLPVLEIMHSFLGLAAVLLRVSTFCIPSANPSHTLDYVIPLPSPLFSN